MGKETWESGPTHTSTIRIERACLLQWDQTLYVMYLGSKTMRSLNRESGLAAHMTLSGSDLDIFSKEGDFVINKGGKMT